MALKKVSISATKNFGQLLRQLNPQQHDMLLEMLENKTKDFGRAYTLKGGVRFVKAFYEAFDLIAAKSFKENISCKKGCHLCCRQNVDISPQEGQVIAEYCEEHDIDIPKDRLEEQLTYGVPEIAATNAGWCIFLKNGECSIYPVRPVACRNYYVQTLPEMCDTVAYPADVYKVEIVVSVMPELFVSAFWAVLDRYGKYGRLPEIMLPYSK
jgi:Fe-S-cluster containining protein